MSEYKRLTRKDEKGRWVAEAGHFCVYHDDKSPSAADMMFGDVVNRLAELENKIESGELVELPRVETHMEHGEIFSRRVVYLGRDGRVHFEYCHTEEQADAFFEKEKARIRERANR